LGAALALYGVVRRTLLGRGWEAGRVPRLAPSVLSGVEGLARDSVRSAHSAAGVAGAAALVWAVHPMQTESVTYIIQRSESLMGLCYLLTLYCVGRGARGEGRGSRWWYAGAVAACAAGMGSKAVMATAPLAVLLYDRTFLAGTLREAWRRRWRLYLGLAATWALLALILCRPHESLTSAGWRVEDVSPWTYALTQAEVVWHYLRLAVWPAPLILDYQWPRAASWTDVALPMAALSALIGASVWACARRHPAGFAGVWVWLVLAPSSSVIPLSDPAAEHRMYLALAGVALLAVAAADAFARRAWANARIRHAACGALLGGVVAVFGLLTIRRNADYATAEGMWRTVLAKRPDNARAHNNLGYHLDDRGSEEEAARAYRRAIELRPSYVEARANLGSLLAEQGRVEEALEEVRAALALDPGHAPAQNSLGVLELSRGRTGEAVGAFRSAVARDPWYAEAYSNLGVALGMAGRTEEALGAFTTAIRLSPDDAETHNNLGNLRFRAGDLSGAVEAYRRALELEPTSPVIRKNFETALKRR
ncbi:MAG TPA: tetratricopeptide repeat protein, partial [bacterium]